MAQAKKQQPNGRRQQQQRRAAGSARNRVQPGRARGSNPLVVRTANRIPRGLNPKHHFNAFGTSAPQALAFSIGPATRISGYRSITLPVEAGEDYLLSFDASGGESQLIAWSRSKGTGQYGTLEANSITSTGFTTTPSASSPETIMCSRGSIRLRNISPAAEVAGLVRILRIGSTLDLNTDPTDPQLDVMKTLIESHQRTHTYSGSTLTETHQWDQIPVSQSQYSQFQSVIQQSSTWNSAARRPLSQVWIYISALTYTQTYEVSFAGDYYCRYGAAGPLANIAQCPPTTTLQHTNYVRDIAESVGSAGLNVVKSVGHSALGYASEAASGYLKNLMASSFSSRAPQLMGGVGRQVGMLALEDAPYMAAAAL